MDVQVKLRIFTVVLHAPTRLVGAGQDGAAVGVGVGVGPAVGVGPLVGVGGIGVGVERHADEKHALKRFEFSPHSDSQAVFPIQMG